MNSYSPHGGGFGAQVTITGTDFQPNQRDSTVTFNGVAASITSWSATQIVATVPSAAISGPLLVNVNSIGSYSGNSFEVANPVIAGIMPPTPPPGGTVVISGSGFGSSNTSSNGTVGWVRLNGLDVTVFSWSDTSLTVSLPPSATSGSLTVTKYNATSNVLPVTIEGAATITGLAPSAGPIGGSVIISGSGFGASQYTGRDYDPETGLRYYRARYYDSTIGRFLSEDPIMLRGGTNFYSYVKNAPVRFVDPTGLESSDNQEKNNAISRVGYYNAWMGYLYAGEASRAAQEWAHQHGFDPATLHNGAPDAFRHCFWSCTMAKYLGQDVAEAIGDEHELAGKRHGQPPDEELMDRMNNLKGKGCRE